jgi:NAD(P)-dependent dehydrogenase (short-subunit alcohol dehydrogenase family)
VVVTGGAGGIGGALARRFAAEGARGVVVADLDLDRAQGVADEIGGLAIAVDVREEQSIEALIGEATGAFGPIDVFFSNAGIAGPGGGPLETENDDWQAIWEANVMAHIWAARHVLPDMLERGEGYLVSTASAAGLLTQISALAYSVTKHAAVAVAEWLAINYRDRGIRVSCLCPQGVRTPMLDIAMEDTPGARSLRASAILDPRDVAEAVVEGLREERFLILPHPDVAKYMAFKAAQPDKWQEAMRGFLREDA